MFESDLREAAELIADALRRGERVTDVEVIEDDPGDILIVVALSHLGRVDLQVLG